MSNTPAARLQQELKLRNLLTFAFGAMIGVGWMIVAGDWINDAGPVGAALGFIGGGLMIVLVSLSYAEMAAMYPVSGGEVAYVYSTFGFRPAFVVAWFLALAYIAAGPFEFVAVGWVTTTLVPEIEGTKLYSVYGYDIYLGAVVISSLVAISIATINYWGAKVASRTQDFLSYALIAITLVFVGFAFVNGASENLIPWFASDENKPWFAGVLTVLVTTPLWYAGFDVVSQMMGEKETGESMHNMGRVFALAIVGVIIFYCLVIFATSIAVPRETLDAFSFPVAGALEAAFRSPIGSKIVMTAALLGLITSWNAVFYASTRIVFAMGRAHMLPPWFSYINPKHHTPSHAVLFVFFISFAGLLGRSAISPFIDMTSLIYASTFLVVCIAVLILRYRSPDAPRPYRAPSIAVPFLAMASMTWLVWLIVTADLQSALDGRVPPQWYVIIAWAVCGLIFWRLARPLRSEMSEEKLRQLILEQD